MCQSEEWRGFLLNLKCLVNNNRAMQSSSSLPDRWKYVDLQFKFYNYMVSELKGRKRTRASCRIRVSLESRYGMWNALPGEPQVRAFITFPRAERDLLMVLASSRTFPSAPVFSAFSDPAKSTRSNFPALTLPTVSNVTINSSNLESIERRNNTFFL